MVAVMVWSLTNLKKKIRLELLSGCLQNHFMSGKSRCQLSSLISILNFSLSTVTNPISVSLTCG